MRYRGRRATMKVTMINLLTVAVVFLSIFVQIFCHPGMSSSSSSVAGHKRSLNHRRSTLSKSDNHAVYFLSAVSDRHFRFRRSAAAVDSALSSDHRQPEVGLLLRQVREDDGSGSDEFELTPVNQFLDDRLLSNNDDVSRTTTSRFNADDSTTSISTSVNHVQPTSPIYSVDQSYGGGLAVAVPPGSEDVIRAVNETTSQQQLQHNSTTYVYSPDGSIGNDITTVGHKQESPLATDIPLEVASTAQVKSKEIPESSVGSSLKAWVIVISTVIGCLLICTVIIAAVRYAIKQRKARSQWSTETNGNSNGSNSNHTTSSN